MDTLFIPLYCKRKRCVMIFKHKWSRTEASVWAEWSAWWLTLINEFSSFYYERLCLTCVDCSSETQTRVICHFSHCFFEVHHSMTIGNALSLFCCQLSYCPGTSQFFLWPVRLTSWAPGRLRSQRRLGSKRPGLPARPSPTTTWRRRCAS